MKWPLLMAVVALSSTALLAPRAHAQDPVSSAANALARWQTAYADFAKKGEELVADYTVAFIDEWKAEYTADLETMDAAAAELAAISGLEGDLATLVAGIAADTPGATEAAASGLNNMVSDAGASLRAAYDQVGAVNANVTEALALTQAAGVTPAATGSAGVVSSAAAIPAAVLLMVLAAAAAIVAGGRVATGRFSS